MSCTCTSCKTLTGLVQKVVTDSIPDLYQDALIGLVDVAVALSKSTWLSMQEVEVNDEDVIQQLMEHSHANRSTGSTGANAESSRSHSIMQVLTSSAI